MDQILLNNFLKIQAKIIQVLGIENELEKRKMAVLERLRNSQENDDMMKWLNFLVEIYNRELRVLEYCRIGLKNAKDVLESSEIHIFAGQNKMSLLKIYARRIFSAIVEKADRTLISLDSKITGMEKSKYNAYEDAKIGTDLLKAIYLELEIKTFESYIILLEDTLIKQKRYLSELLKEGKKGVLVGNIAWYDDFKNFEIEKSKGLQIINEIKAKSRRGKIILRIEKINDIIRRNKILAGIQPIVIPSTSSLVSWPTAVYFSSQLGIIMIPLVILCFTIIRWSPSAAIVLKEWKNL